MCSNSNCIEEITDIKSGSGSSLTTAFDLNMIDKLEEMSSSEVNFSREKNAIVLVPAGDIAIALQKVSSSVLRVCISQTLDMSVRMICNIL